jgi:multiple sugar transport system permease protein
VSARAGRTDDDGQGAAGAPPGPTAHRRASRRTVSLATRRQRSGYLLAFPGLAFLALLVVYPLVYNGWTSVHEVSLGSLIGNAPTPFNGLDNYDVTVSDRAFWHAVRVSATFTAGSLLFQFTIGFALAVLCVRRFPLSGLFQALLLLAWLLPPIVSGTLFRWMLDADSGAYNALLRAVGLDGLSHNWLTDPSTALLGVIFANVWVGVPFNMVLLTAGLQNIDPELYEAAALDGANAWQRFRLITLPLMKPVSAVVLLLGLIYTFKVFDIVFVMTGGGPVDATTVLPLYVYQVFFTRIRFGEGAAAGLLLVIVPLIAAVLYVRRLRRERAAV